MQYEISEPKFDPLAGLTEGRMVHYVMPNGQHRPAIVLNVWSKTSGCSNLNVFTDYTNDVPYDQAELETMKHNFNIKPEEVAHGHIWKTSILFSVEPVPGTWHWIERA
jgi:hypothetical protein